jgi:hypothetical protein
LTSRRTSDVLAVEALADEAAVVDVETVEAPVDGEDTEEAMIVAEAAEGAEMVSEAEDCTERPSDEASPPTREETEDGSVDVSGIVDDAPPGLLFIICIRAPPDRRATKRHPVIRRMSILFSRIRSIGFFISFRRIFKALYFLDERFGFGCLLPPYGCLL